MIRSWSLALVLLAACGPVDAAPELPPTTPTEPPPTADDEKGKTLLLLEETPGPGQPGESSVSVVRGDGSGKKLLATNAMSPNWTPDGRVVFASTRSGSQRSWIMDADGSNAKQLGALDASVKPVMPQLGKNGVVVFMGQEVDQAPDTNGLIWAMKEDGTDLHELAVGMQPSLAISGTWVAYTFQTDEPYHREIWRVDVDGGNKRALTALGDPDYPDANAPNISPDESLVAFFSGKESDRAIPGSPMQSVFTWGHRNVAIVPAAGGARTTLTPCHPVTTQAELDATSDVTGDCVAADNPAWTPDGQWLVFDTGFAKGTETWMVDVTGKGFQEFYARSRGVVRRALKIE